MLILTPEHILITFAFGEKSKGIANICTNIEEKKPKTEHIKWSVRFLNTERHIWANICVIFQAIVKNKHVY